MTSYLRHDWTEEEEYVFKVSHLIQRGNEDNKEKNYISNDKHNLKNGYD